MIHTIQSIKPICQELKSQSKKLVLATGFFDLLHEEHVNFLQKAKAAGDILVVAVESDVRARKIKGEGRPKENQSIRCQKLLNLQFPGKLENWKTGVLNIVDYVIALPDDFDHYEAFDSLMSAVRPSIYAISSHTAHQDKKSALTEKYGGKLLVVHDWNPSTSTTQIINSQNHV